MKMFHSSFAGVMIRYYLMMAVIIVAGFTGIWALAFLALPIFMTCLLGLRFGRDNARVETTVAPRAKAAPKRTMPQEVQHAA